MHEAAHEVADERFCQRAGMLGSAYDTAASTAQSAVQTGAGLVEKTANYIGDTAAKYSKK